MKKVFLMIILFVSIFTLTGCESSSDVNVINDYITVTADKEGNVIIDTTDITSVATFVNYEVDIDVTIQFIVVRGTDGKVRIAFNTCQACNPSPNSYFVQVGDYLQCQNCGNKFHIDKIGEEKGGCNPTPVEEKKENDNQIIIASDYVGSYKEKFKNWNGPTK